MGTREQSETTDTLTPRQRAFVEAYLIDPNATQAAISAGYSKKTAAEQGTRLLRNVHVAAEIAARQSERAEQAKLTSVQVLNEIDTLASSDLGALFDLDADALRLLPMREWPIDARRSVASVKVKVYPLDKPDIDDETLADLEKLAESLTAPILRRVVSLLREVRWDQYQIVELKLWDKNSALDKAAKHRGMFTDKVEITGKDGEPLMQMEAARRAVAMAEERGLTLVKSDGKRRTG